jgi:copper chaperone
MRERLMIALNVPDMTCAHCSRVITEAVLALDANAKINIDLAAHRVEIESQAAQATELLAALCAQGYTPELLP